MFGFLDRFRKKRLTYEQLQILQFVVQQVVVSVEGSVNLPGARKKALALELVGRLLEEMGLVAPESLLDLLLESSVSLLKAMDVSLEPPNSSGESP